LSAYPSCFKKPQPFAELSTSLLYVCARLRWLNKGVRVGVRWWVDEGGGWMKVVGESEVVGGSEVVRWWVE
jgi:hypothetical protein